jgi:hypothetical protein
LGWPGTAILLFLPPSFFLFIIFYSTGL